MNGHKHLIATISIAITLFLSVGAGFFWAGQIAAAQDDQKSQSERRGKQFGQMDMRQRALENTAATVKQQLKDMKENQKAILKALRERR